MLNFGALYFRRRRVLSKAQLAGVQNPDPLVQTGLRITRIIDNSLGGQIWRLIQESSQSQMLSCGGSSGSTIGDFYWVSAALQWLEEEQIDR